jgi:putative addiction module CopG family antidote
MHGLDGICQSICYYVNTDDRSDENVPMTVKELKLSTKHKQFIAREIKAGRFRDESEVLSAGIELLSKNKKPTKERKTLKQLLQEGIDQIDRGQVITLNTPEEVKAFHQQLFDRAVQDAKRRK